MVAVIDACRTGRVRATIVVFALLTAPPPSARAEDDPFSLVREEQTITGAAKRPHGWQLSQSLRERDDGVTIAFVTGWGEEVEAEQVKNAGADTVVSKPFGLEDVARVTKFAAERPRKRAA